jgi:hypothetical protein
LRAWGVIEWGALIVGAGLIASGARAIYRRKAEVPETYEGSGAVNLGCLWIALGLSFVIAVAFDVQILKAFFKLFLEAAN